MRGFDLYGKTFDTIGAGAIGLHAIRIAKGFGMEVLAHDLYQNQLLADSCRGAGPTARPRNQIRKSFVNKG